MDYKSIINKLKPEADKVLAFLDRELSQIRTSHASPALVENIMVECFGQTMPLKQLGTITNAGPRQLVIQPWDKSYIEAIDRAMTRSNLGASVSVNGDVIRLSLPPLSEEYRASLLKLLSEKMEESRRVLRRWREEIWKEIQDKTRAGEVREDDKFRAKEELQKLMDEYGEKIETLGERKKKEVSE